jgi:rubredoxin
MSASSATAVEEDRFVDAPGEPQEEMLSSMTCPVCNTAFPPEFVTPEDFEMHVDAHYTDAHGPVCPMCDKQFDVDTSALVFERHVNEHFSSA